MLERIIDGFLDTAGTRELKALLTEFIGQGQAAWSKSAKASPLATIAPMVRAIAEQALY